MKPVKLTMSAFGPYADKVEIPFDELLEQGLYLITGDTGAGKTTIFDGITYALYGEASGKNREVSSMRSDFAVADTDTYVELEFLLRGETYKVRRRPEYDRPKKRGTGNTKVQGDAELTCPDGTVITGIRPVTAKVEELLGIDRNQFSQIVMIAQGDFLRLLHANTGERREIFRKIFNTDKYQILQVKLKEESKKLRGAYDDGVKSVSQYARQLRCGEAFIQAETFHALQDENDYYKIHELVELCEACCEEDAEAEQVQNSELKGLERELSILDQRIGKAEQHTENLRLRENTALQLQEQQELQSELESRCQAAEETATECERLYHEIVRLRGLMPSYDSLEEAAKEKMRLESAHRNACEMQLLSEKELTEMNAQILHLETERKSYATTAVELEKKSSEYGALLQRITRLTCLRDAYDQWQTEVVVLQRRQGAYRTASEKYNAADERRKELETRFLNEQAGIMAAELEEGAPCPVCGAVHHPKLAVCADHAPTQDEVEEAKVLAAVLRDEVFEKSRQAAAQEGKMRAAEKSCLAQAGETLGQCVTDDISRETATQLTLVEQRAEELEKMIQALERDIVREKQLEEDLNELQTRKQILEERCRVDSETVQELHGKVSAAQARVETLGKDLEYPSKAAAMEVLSEKEIQHQKLEQEQKQVQSAREEGRVKLQELQGMLSALDRTLNVEHTEPPEELRKKRQSLLEQQETAVKKRTEIFSRLTENRRLLGAIAERQKELEEISEEYLILENLSETANGELKGKPRIAFESYIQGAYFEQVIAAANQRLNYMSSGRYELQRQMETTSLRGQSGLELDVMDYYTGKRRSVKTLSGGESFKASLALALGLSDIVQQYAGGVEIDAMFVDEGFGSLDAESREQAIAILKGLSGGNRLVGIISHVAEFRESIDTQIVITKGARGSTVQLVK